MILSDEKANKDDILFEQIIIAMPLLALFSSGPHEKVVYISV